MNTYKPLRARMRSSVIVMVINGILALLGFLAVWLDILAIFFPIAREVLVVDIPWFADAGIVVVVGFLSIMGQKEANKFADFKQDARRAFMRAKAEVRYMEAGANMSAFPDDLRHAHQFAKSADVDDSIAHSAVLASAVTSTMVVVAVSAVMLMLAP